MARYLKKAMMAFLLITALLYLPGVTLLPSVGKWILIGSLEKSLDKKIKIRSLFYLPHSGFNLLGLSVLDKRDKRLFTIDRVKMNLNWLALLYRRIVIEESEIQFGDVIIKPRRIELAGRTEYPGWHLEFDLGIIKGFALLLEKDGVLIPELITFKGNKTLAQFVGLSEEGTNVCAVAGKAKIDLAEISKCVYPVLSAQKLEPLRLSGLLSIPIELSYSLGPEGGMNGNINVSADKIVIERFVLNDLRVDAVLEDEQVYIRAFNTRLWGGSVAAELEFDLSKSDAVVNGTINAKALDLKELSAFFSKDGSSFMAGSLDGYISASGARLTETEFRAQGGFSVNGGYLLESDDLESVFMALRLIRPELEKLVFEKAEGAFEITADLFQTEDFRLESEVVSLKVIGIYWFCGFLDFSLAITPHFADDLLSSIIGAGVYLMAGEAVKLRMTGQLEDIKISNDYIPVIDNIPGTRKINKKNKSLN